MRRAKLGDVYAMRLPNGIKLFQWAYTIPKYGKYMRVFEGLYETIPENIAQIVQGEHSYIIEFQVSSAYRIGLIEFLENIAVPEKYPCPVYSLEFHFYSRCDKFDLDVRQRYDPTSAESGNTYTFKNLTSIKELPEKFRNTKLLAGFYPPICVMYLFDYNFNLDNPHRYAEKYVLGEKAGAVFDAYEKRIERLLNADKAKRNATKK